MNNYEYLTELGIVNFEFAENKVQQIIKTQCLILEKYSNYLCSTDSTERTLLIKMLASIGITIDNTVIKYTDNHQNEVLKYNSDIIVLLGDFNDKAYFIMPHPHDILKNNNLKRDAWEVLKKIKKCL